MFHRESESVARLQMGTDLFCRALTHYSVCQLEPVINGAEIVTPSRTEASLTSNRATP